MAVGKVLTKTAREKFKKKLKREADKRLKEEGEARRAKAKKEGTERKPTVSRSFKKDYEVDIGRESGASASVRTAPQRKVRGTGGRAADTGSDPIVVGSKSMPSMRDAASPASKRRAERLNKAEKIVRDGTASKSVIAKAKETIKEIKALDLASLRSQQGGKRQAAKLAPGDYHSIETGEVITVPKSQISAKPVTLPGNKAQWLKDPTPREFASKATGTALRKFLKRKGISPENDAVKAGMRRNTRLGKGVESFGKFGSEIGQRTTKDEKTSTAVRKYGRRARKRQEQKMERKLQEKLDKADKKAKGGMGMKKKGYAKGGMKKKGMARGGAMMKKKGMAMGGLKKPAANQTGLKKLPTTVRNKMGYAQKGGMMKKKGMARGGMKKKGYAMGGMRVKYKVGGMVKGKTYGSVDNRKKK